MVMKAAKNINQTTQTSKQTDPKLLSMLVCPLTRTTLIYDRDNQCLISLQAGLSYPITDNVPVLLEEAGTVLSDDERAYWKNRIRARNR